MLGLNLLFLLHRSSYLTTQADFTYGEALFDKILENLFN